MADEYIEVILKLTANADAERVRNHFQRAGLSVTRMTSGFLLSGAKKEIEKALSIELETVHSASSLPVPADLQKDVESLRIPAPRRYQT